MLFERIYEEGLAQASYFIGCQREGSAMVVDARRDIQTYLDLADKHGMTITAVTETHIHADYLSGTRELANATGATIYLSAEGGPDWHYGFEGEQLFHGSAVQLGNITVTALHTPGHTPEHLSFLVTDGAVSAEAGFILTGDFVFVGDLGRPDLLDEAAGGVDTRFEGAKQLFHSLKARFLTLPDHVQVFPAHGAGSPCGRALGAVPSTTVGYERRTAWWGPFVENDDEQGFVDELLSGQPDAHAYFARMKRENRDGPAILGALPRVTEISGEEAQRQLDSGAAVFVDTREQDDVHAGTVEGSLNIPAGTKAANFAGWVIDPERNSSPLIVLATNQAAAEDFRDCLLRVGIDTVSHFVTALHGLRTVQPELLSPSELSDTQLLADPSHSALVDIRSTSEFATGSIPGAQQLSGGSALWRLDELPQPADTSALVTFCQSGARNAVVASALRREGYRVVELEGSYAAWADQAQQPH